MSSSPEKVQVDPNASNMKKPPAGELTASGNTRKIEQFEDNADNAGWVCCGARDCQIT